MRIMWKAVEAGKKGARKEALRSELPEVIRVAHDPSDTSINFHRLLRKKDDAIGTINSPEMLSLIIQDESQATMTRRSAKFRRVELAYEEAIIKMGKIGYGYFVAGCLIIGGSTALVLECTKDLGTDLDKAHDYGHMALVMGKLALKVVASAAVDLVGHVSIRRSEPYLHEMKDLMEKRGDIRRRV